MRLAVVLNASAGSIVGRTPQQVVDEVDAAFAAAGHHVRCTAVAPDRVGEALARAASQPVDAVIVGGGDGTVASAARILAGSGKALGVLPLGTMNLLARDLGVPPDLHDAVTALATGSITRIDMAEVNGIPFLNNSVIGLYPRMVEERERQRGRHGLGKWTAMGLAALKTLWSNPRLVVRLEIQGRRRTLFTPVLAVANNVYDGGWGPVLRRSDLTAGTLAVYAARHADRKGLASLFVGFLLGNWRADPEVEMLTATDLTVHTVKARIRVANDGEVHRLPGPLRYRIRPGGLLVLRPAGTVAAGAEPTVERVA